MKLCYFTLTLKLPQVVAFSTTFMYWKDTPAPVRLVTQFDAEATGTVKGAAAVLP